MMQRIETKNNDAAKWTGTICPKIMKKLDKFTEWSAGAFVTPATNGLFHVSTGEFEKEYVVDFPTRTCTCNRWQISGIPCHHAIACCRADRIPPESLVHPCYTKETYLEAYGYNINPIRGKAFWEKVNGVHVFPPLYTKIMGRPKKNRKKAPEEKKKDGVTYITRAGLTMHCSICGKANHNKKGHNKYLESVQMDEQEVVQEGEEAYVDDPYILQV
jgi:hypothetical protein